MGFRINTNIAAMNAHTNSTMNNRNLDNSLSKLSSGLRINTAADDASGLAIANSLRAQASSLGQAVANGNDAIGLIQTADGALSEYSNILDTIKTKSVQAASDTQNQASRLAIQKDIDALMEELNIIATTTSFNGQKLLSGTFVNKEFQMGANANESVSVNIASATTNSIGQTTRADLNMASNEGGDLQLTLTSAITGKSVSLKNVAVSYDNDRTNSLGAVADEINRYSGDTGITAKAVVESSADSAVGAGVTSSDFAINGVTIGAINVAENDNDNTLLNAINGKTNETGVSATLSSDGKLTLASDGRAIKVEGDVSTVLGASASEMTTVGKIELVQQGSSEFQIEGIGAGATGADITVDSTPMQTTKDSTLAAGSTIAAGSEIAVGSTIGGDAKVLESVANTQLDTNMKAGSTLAMNSVIAAGTTVGGTLTVGGDEASSPTALTRDAVLNEGSRLLEGSVVGKGTILSDNYTDAGGTTYTAGTTLSAALTLDNGNMNVTSSMTLAYSSTDSDNSKIAVGSTMTAGSTTGADTTQGIVYDSDTDVAFGTAFAADTESTVDYRAETDIVSGANAGDNVTIAAGSILTDGSVVELATSTSYSGPTLVTTSGVISEGDEVTAGQFTLKGDQTINEEVTFVNTGTAMTLKAGSVLMAGSEFVQAAPASGTLNEVTAKSDMALSDDMTLSAGSTLGAGSTLLSGSTLGDNTKIYGTGTNNTLETNALSDIQSGSTIENGSIIAEGSTIGGAFSIASNTTLTGDMSAKAGTIIGENSVLKAGTLLNQDMTLKSGTAEVQTATLGAMTSGESININDRTITIDGSYSAGSGVTAAAVQDAYLSGTSVTGVAETQTIVLGALTSGDSFVINGLTFTASANQNVTSADVQAAVLAGATTGAVSVSGTATVAGLTLDSGATNNSVVYTFGTNGDKDLLATTDTDTTFTTGLAQTQAGQIGITVGGTLSSDFTIASGGATVVEFTASTGGNKDELTDTVGTAANAVSFDTTSEGTGSQAAITTVDIKAGETLTSDLLINKSGGETLSSDMMLKEGSILASGSSLAVNTENSGSVGLSNSEFTNLSDIDVTTLEGAMDAIDTVSAAISNLDAIRSELGSTQNQVVSTINNISVTQVNVKAAESNIRDVDFAAESANFSKFNILAQSGSYAMSQANAVQQNVMRLLQ